MLICPRTLSLLTILGVASAAPALTHAQDGDSKFVLHGYLNQGYARSDRYSIFGIPKDGTTDYRTIALQGRYAMSDEDQFVVQVRNRSTGTSLVTDPDADVALDWAYYQHDFGIVKARLGKGPIPLGLYNDVRSVGTVLPFFRAPGNFYMEGIESIEGVTLTNRTTFGTWSLETTVYGGGIGLQYQVVLPAAYGGTSLTKVHTENNAGAQMWLSTPLQGVRVGVSGLRFRVGLLTDTVMAKLYVASLDATFDRFFVRGEYRPNYSITGTGIVQNAAYGQVGLKLTEQLSVNGQVENMNNDQMGHHIRYAYDRAISVDYAYQPNIVFKIEGHRNNGFNYDTYIQDVIPAPLTNYGIASMAVSF